MPAPFIWRYTATPNATLPKWAQNKDLFTGGYVSSNGRKTARLASNISANRSGKVTNGFMKALCRARMIRFGCDKDGYGGNNDYSIAQMTMGEIFEGDKVGLGEMVNVVYNRKAVFFYR